METLGLIVFASLFVLSGLNHIRNHAATAGYTASVLPEPLKPLGPLGGAPTGVLLVVAGVAAAFSQVWAFYALAGFLAVATGLFHRNFLKDPGGFKGVALIGAALALATLVWKESLVIRTQDVLDQSGGAVKIILAPVIQFL